MHIKCFRHALLVALLVVDFGCVKERSSSTESGKKSEAGAVGVIAAILTGLTLTRCGSASSSTTIASNADAVSNEPTTDATAYDYAITSAATSVRLASPNARLGSHYGGSNNPTYLRLSQTTSSDGKRVVTIDQCNNTTWMARSTMTVSKDAHYVTATRFTRESNNVAFDLDVTGGKSLTDEGFRGTLDMHHANDTRLIITANGDSDTNTLKGTKGTGASQVAISCAWNKTSGCAKFRLGSQAGEAKPFTISVNSSTQAKSYDTGTDTSLCSDLTFADTETNPVSSLTDQWNCSLPSSKSDWDATLSVSNSQLEDKGGKSCKSGSSVWETAGDPSSCTGSGASASSVGCFCSQLQATGTYLAKFMVERMLKCKARGVFKLLKEGAISGVDFADGSTIYVKLSPG